VPARELARELGVRHEPHSLLQAWVAEQRRRQPRSHRGGQIARRHPKLDKSLDLRRRRAQLVVVTGSLYLVGSVMASSLAPTPAVC
jgi:folylpolyglutamate synthase/dihydropteroate synthase